VITSPSVRPLGIAHFTVLEVAPPDLVTLAAGAGYSSVGLRLYPAFPGAPYYELPPGSLALRDMRRRLDTEAIQVYDIEFVTIDADFVPQSLAYILESAQYLGAKRISVCGADPEPSRMTRNFRALCDLAADFGMGVDLEFMAWRQVNNLSEAVHIVEAAGRSNGGVLVDALHLARTGGSPSDLTGIPRELIQSVQICDASAHSPTSEAEIIQEARSGRLAPGEGVLPLRELLAELPPEVRLSVEAPSRSKDPAEQRAQHIYNATLRLLTE
jgi:sugar phosphate isomerase/epimerase